MSLNKLEDNLNFLVNGRRPQFLVNERRPQYFVYRRRPQIFGKWKTTSFICKCRQRQNFNTGNTKTKTISTSGKSVLASPSLN